MPDFQPNPLIVLGSSSAEVFDYIFGDTPLYHPMWASGWSARGMADSADFLTAIMDPLPREATVLLAFGMTDIQFNLPWRVRQSRFYDLAGHLAETAAAITGMAAQLRQMGFAQVAAVFTSAAVALPPAYWRQRDLAVLPPALLGQMVLDLAESLRQSGLETRSILPQIIASPDRPVLAPRFCRKAEDHHASYIATQQLVWQAICDLPGMPPRRAEWLTRHYQHQPYSITSWKLSGVARPLTLR